MTVPHQPLSHRSGIAALEVSRVAGQSAAVSCSASSPLKILIPRPRGQSVWAYLSSFGGGMVAGDQTQIEVFVNQGARCFFSTQASTKIYRNSLTHPCTQTFTARLGSDSLFVLYPDVLQPFADGSYTQKQQFHLSKGANLVFVDWFSAGRVARGERWSFRRFESRNEVIIEGRPVLVDSLLLEPALAGGSVPLGRYNCVALVVLIGEALAQITTELQQKVSQAPVEKKASTIQSVSQIPHGTVLRVAGLNVEEVGQTIQTHLKHLGPLIGDNPWQRKW